MKKKLVQSKIGYYYKYLFSQSEELSVENTVSEKTGMGYGVNFSENGNFAGKTLTRNIENIDFGHIILEVVIEKCCATYYSAM